MRRKARPSFLCARCLAAKVAVVVANAVVWIIVSMLHARNVSSGLTKVDAGGNKVARFIAARADEPSVSLKRAALAAATEVSVSGRT